jgi:hypothetical protein
MNAAVKEARAASLKETKVGVKDGAKTLGTGRDGTPRRRGATVSSGLVPEVTAKPRRRQSSASEGLSKGKVRVHMERIAWAHMCAGGRCSIQSMQEGPEVAIEACGARFQRCTFIARNEMRIGHGRIT